MTCNDCDDLLLEYAYEELAAGPRREVETHLPGCERCQSALAELTGTLLAVRTLPVEEPSAAGLESLLAFAGTAARRHREQAAPRAGLFPQWLSRLLFRPGFAVAAVLLVVGVVSLKLSGAISFGGGSQAPGAGDRVHEAAPPAAPAAAPRAEPAFAKEEKKAAPEAPVAATPPAPPAGRGGPPAVEAVLAADPDATRERVEAPVLDAALAADPSSRERAGAGAGSRTTGAGRKSGGGGELQESEGFSKSRGSFAEPPAESPRPRAKADAQPTTPGPAAGKAQAQGGSATLDAPAPTASAQAAAGAAPKSAVGGAVGSFRDDGTGSEQGELAGAGAEARAAAYGAPIARKSVELAKDAGDPKAELDQAEALFREAERLSGSARHAEAVKLFLRVAQEYPSTLRARQALYAAWLLELDRGNTAAAASLLAELAQRYPGSQELQRARSREAKHVEEELARQPSAKPKKGAGPPKQPGRDLEDDQAPADAAAAPAASPVEPATQQAR